MLIRDHSLLKLVDVADQTYLTNIDLLQSLLDKPAARVHIVIGQLLFYLTNVHAVRNRLQNGCQDGAG
jgi:hypothetical protein